MHYDSMIAKLITHGATRDQAIARMHDALSAFVIRGISSNLAFQAAVTRHPRFVAGQLPHRASSARSFPEGFHPSALLHEDPLLLASVAAYARRRYIQRAVRITGQLKGHERRVGSEWVVLMQGQKYQLITRSCRRWLRRDLPGENLSPCAPTGSSADCSCEEPGTARTSAFRSSGWDCGTGSITGAPR